MRTMKTTAMLFMGILLMGCTGISKADPSEKENRQDIPTDSLTSLAADYDGPDSEAEGLVPYEKELLDISEMPQTAEQQDSYFHNTVYVNVEQEPTENDPTGIYSVWLADEKVGTVRKICQTNPTATPNWEKMSGKKANAVDVPIHLIAVAEKAYLAPGDVGKVIVEGCPDGRNIWTYIIDVDTHTAKQFPSTEGVVNLDWEKKEIILSAYGYDDDGRYAFISAYDLDGKYLRTIEDKIRE